MRLLGFSQYTLYNLRGGFLLRPFVCVIALGGSGAVLSWAEEHWPALGAWLPALLFPSRADPQVAQVVLGTIATSIMTVVGIVFAILLMTLTLASMQFSPRIIANFIKDKVTQLTLGIFLGTFAYCLAALPAARSQPAAFAPVLTVAGAMVLAVCCVGWLLYFIHHISMAITVSHIVDQLAGETCEMVDQMMPRHGTPAPPGRRFEALGAAFDLPAGVAGYIRSVDLHNLLRIAERHDLRIQLAQRVGKFIQVGAPLLRVTAGAGGARLRGDAGLGRRLLRCVELGPTRTLQQDVEFGVLQIVDIALRAISPAVNDPSTAIACIDQLCRILVRVLGREPAPVELADRNGVARLHVFWPDLARLLDSAYEQIRLYARADLAVSLRLLKAFGDLLAQAVRPQDRALLIERGERVCAECRSGMAPLELRQLEQRWSQIVAPTAA